MFVDRHHHRPAALEEPTSRRRSPNIRFPMRTTLNAAIPMAEWEIGLNGKPTSAVEARLCDLHDRSEDGRDLHVRRTRRRRQLASSNLEEQIAVMRMLRGSNVLPIVRLEQRPMKTQFGMKSRPHLQIIDWRAPGDGGPMLAPQSSTPAAHRTGDGCGPRSSGSGSCCDCTCRDCYGGSCCGGSCSGGFISSSSSTGCSSNPAGVDGPRQHATGQTGDGGGAHRRRAAAVGLMLAVNATSNDSARGA